MTDRAEEIARLAKRLDDFNLDGTGSARVDVACSEAAAVIRDLSDALRASEERAEKAKQDLFWSRKEAEGVGSLLLDVQNDCIAAEARVKELEARLEMNFAWRIDEGTGQFVRIEVEPGSIPDGIDARDETIKLQDANNDRLRARVKELEAALRTIDRHNDNPALYNECIDICIRAALGASHDD